MSEWSPEPAASAAADSSTSSTDRSSHTSSTALLADVGRQSSSSSQPSNRKSNTPTALEKLVRPTHLSSPTKLASRRLTRWKRIQSDDLDKSMTEEDEEEEENDEKNEDDTLENILKNNNSNNKKKKIKQVFQFSFSCDDDDGPGSGSSRNQQSTEEEGTGMETPYREDLRNYSDGGYLFHLQGSGVPPLSDTDGDSTKYTGCVRPSDAHR
ncbi:unnamed protein product [Meganyctiphanes norvegica]|uniref:Uncharacterized protein n=1 Tax=Meganyctiphanes norvegica TaxID=48144 RepID=A0AAV2QYX9_MEGNR